MLTLTHVARYRSFLAAVIGSVLFHGSLLSLLWPAPAAHSNGDTLPADAGKPNWVELESSVQRAPLAEQAEAEDVDPKKTAPLKADRLASALTKPDKALPRPPRQLNKAHGLEPLAAGSSPKAAPKDWISIEDQLKAEAPPSKAVKHAQRAAEASAPDPLVARLMAREQQRAAEWAQTLPSTANSVAPATVSPRPLGAAESGRADPEMALLRALPAAIALAPWSEPGVHPRQTLRLNWHLLAGRLTQLNAEPNQAPEVASLGRNLFELLRHERFTDTGSEPEFEVALTLSHVENSQLPALGFTPPSLGTDGSAYVIFASGLRVTMKLRPL